MDADHQEGKYTGYTGIFSIPLFPPYYPTITVSATTFSKQKCCVTIKVCPEQEMLADKAPEISYGSFCLVPNFYTFIALTNTYMSRECLRVVL